MRQSWDKAPPNIKRRIEAKRAEYGLRAAVLEARRWGYCWPADFVWPVHSEMDRLITEGRRSDAYYLRDSQSEAYRDELDAMSQVRCLARWAVETSLEDDVARREQLKKDEAAAAKVREKAVAARAKELEVEATAQRRREFTARASLEISR
jgi:hypothetical protein